MARINKGERIGRLLDRERQDSKDSLEALRLQVKAWRLLAIIGIADPERGRREARWLIMHSYPWINADSFRSFIADREEEAQRLGIEAGIFDQQSPAT
jgi:hypothetical protein